jgi:hypothetical protein
MSGRNNTMDHDTMYWKSGDTSYEPLDIIAKNITMLFAEYAKGRGLLDTAGW